MGINDRVKLEEPDVQPDTELTDWELDLLEAAEDLTDDEMAAFGAAIEYADLA